MNKKVFLYWHGYEKNKIEKVSLTSLLLKKISHLNLSLKNKLLRSYLKLFKEPTGELYQLETPINPLLKMSKNRYEYYYLKNHFSKDDLLKLATMLDEKRRIIVGLYILNYDYKTIAEKTDVTQEEVISTLYEVLEMANIIGQRNERQQ